MSKSKKWEEIPTYPKLPFSLCGITIKGKEISIAGEIITIRISIE